MITAPNDCCHEKLIIIMKSKFRFLMSGILSVVQFSILDNQTMETAAAAAAAGEAASAPTAASASSQPSRLPSHPTARAFFDALDGRNPLIDSCRTAANKRRTSAFVEKQLTLLGWRNRHSQDEHYPVTVGTTTFTVLQVQRGEIEGTYGTGACVWPAAMVLLKYMEHQTSANASNSIVVKDKTVVDLGSGTGVTSIAAALLGASRVICTDGCDRVVQLARENINNASQEINGHDHNSSTDTEADTFNSNSNSNSSVTIRGCQLYTQELWWGRDAIHDPGPADIVLVADCVLPKLYPIAPLVQAIDELLVKPSAIAWISYEHRYYPDYHPRDKFQELATARGLVVETVPMEDHDPIYSVDDIEIWKVYRPHD
jgi:predicted nicotinamide N-methyase